MKGDLTIYYVSTRLVLSIFCLLFSIQTNILSADTEVIGNFAKISQKHEISLKINPVEPQVGICNLTINIFDIENQKYITSAKVEIFVNNQDLDKPYKSFALSHPAVPKDYTAKFNFKKSGDWEIKIKSSLENNQHQEVTFNINVKENPLQSQTEGTILWIFVSSILIIAPIIIWYKNKKP